MYITYFSIFPWSYKLLSFVTFIFCRKKSSNTNIPCAFLQQVCLPQRFNTKNYCNQRNAFEFDQGSLNFSSTCFTDQMISSSPYKFQIPNSSLKNSKFSTYSMICRVSIRIESLKRILSNPNVNETDKKKTEIRDFGWSIPSILECHCQTHEQL